jgi:hypothetical protein
MVGNKRKMSELSAKHYLDIFKARLSMADDKLTHPREDLVEAVRRLVKALAELDPDEKIVLEIDEGQANYRRVKTREIIASLPSE